MKPEGCPHCQHESGWFVGLLWILIFASISLMKYRAEEREKKIVAGCRETGQRYERLESRVNLWPSYISAKEYLCHDEETHEEKKVWVEK